MSARAWLLVSILGWTSLWLGGAGGCGSALYINQVTRKASASVAAAEAVNAAEYAPYEYTLAVEYLHKAREEAAHADFQAANRFGREAEAAADQATELAVQRAGNPEDISWRPPPGTPGGGAAPAPESDGDGDGDGDAGEPAADELEAEEPAAAEPAAAEPAAAEPAADGEDAAADTDSTTAEDNQ